MLKFNNARPVWRLLSWVRSAFSRSYMDGDWDSPDIAGFLELAIANEGNWEGLMSPSALLGKLALLRHKLRRNSKAGSRRNIAFHYDLGNDFYRQWLDTTMTYSSALYAHPSQPLPSAGRKNISGLWSNLRLGLTIHVLEIGCGWGGFAEHAIRASGCRVTGLTLSKEQAAYARARLRQLISASTATSGWKITAMRRGTSPDRLDRDVRSGRGRELAGLLQPRAGPAGGGRSGNCPGHHIDENRFEQYQR